MALPSGVLLSHQQEREGFGHRGRALGFLRSTSAVVKAGLHALNPNASMQGLVFVS